MNKVLNDGDILVFDSSITDIEVKGNAIMYINNICNYNLNIFMHDNSELKVLSFNQVKSITKINVNQNNNSVFKLFHSFISDDNYDININCNITGDNNINDIYIKGVSKKKSFVTVDGCVKEHTKGNVLNESIKILNDGGVSATRPILKINALDVIANHNTAITNFDENILFYMNSKGIDNDSAKKLIIDSYLYGMFRTENEFLNIIQ